MLFPIQAAPINRANRAITMTASARTPGIAPALVGDILSIYCMACKLFPKLPLCPTLCPT